MGEFMEQLLTDPSVGAFFRLPEVLEAKKNVSEEAQELLKLLVTQQKIQASQITDVTGNVHCFYIATIRRAVEGDVITFFHDACTPQFMVRDVISSLNKMKKTQLSVLAKDDIHQTVAEVARGELKTINQLLAISLLKDHLRKARRYCNG